MRCLDYFLFSCCFRMKIVKGTPLDDFVSAHNLVYPQIAIEQAKIQNLVAELNNERERTDFYSLLLPQPETFDIQEFDVRDAKWKSFY